MPQSESRQPAPQQPQSEEKNLTSLWSKVAPVVISIISLTLLIAFVFAFRAGLECIAGAPTVAQDIVIQYLAHILFAGIFPLTAIAYGLFQRAAQEEELEQDLRFLGIERTDTFGSGTGTGDGTKHRYNQIMRRFRTGYSQWNYALQYALPMLTTVLGLSIFFHRPSELFPELVDPLAVTAIKYGFLGAYVYSIQYIYRRFTTSDLQPSIYMHCGLVLVAGMVFNYVAFNFIGSADVAPAVPTQTDAAPLRPVEGGLQAIIAFSLGYFPALAIRWFSRIAYGALGVKQRRADFLPLGLIDGISQFHESRLRDEGIDNIQNLASAKIDELLVKTPFGLQEVIEWVDQAILYMYLEPSEIESFRRGGVRTITDFHAHWWKLHIDNPRGERPVMLLRVDQQNQESKKMDPAEAEKELTEWKTKRATRAQQLQSTPERLDALYDNTVEGPNMAHVRYYWIAKGLWTERILRVQVLQFDKAQKEYEAERKRLDLPERDLTRLYGRLGSGGGSGYDSGLGFGGGSGSGSGLGSDSGTPNENGGDHPSKSPGN